MSDSDARNNRENVSRRAFMATAGTGLAALAATGCAPAGQDCAPTAAAAGPVLDPANAPQAPFDTLREWMAAMEAHGAVMRFDGVDQDAYHTTGLFFRTTDKFGMYEAPAMIFENIKQDGQWFKGPVIVNHQGHWVAESLIWGLEPVPGDHFASYRQAKAHLHKMLEANGGVYPQIPPAEVSNERALCKQVVLTGDAIDLNSFAFLKTNPADGGRYVNTGSVFMHDPEMGPNFGTYRCQIKGPRKLGLNSETNHMGYKMVVAARERGETRVPVSIVLGQDPVTWTISSSAVVDRRVIKGKVDELAVAGGMRGKPIDVVKCETNDIQVPAHAEMIIEGYVPLDVPLEDEGPFGEMFGYLGPVKKDNFWIEVTAITHRRDPWIINALTGMQKGMVTAPMDCLYENTLRRIVPNFVDYHMPHDVMGVVAVSIDKNAPGQGLEAGRAIAARNPIAKVVIVVDKDIDVLSRTAIVFAVGSRWQPDPASEIIADARGIITDPSQLIEGRTSKIIIDATRQLPEEGGREKFPETNRALLLQGAPEIFAEVDALYGQRLIDYKRV
jgi:4-hydroxy-3-polyprenylbenzoate decarboxylase